MHVIKRSGKKVDFDKSKILNAIKAANNDIKRCDKKAAMQYKEIMAAATIVSHNIKKQNTDISVEDIQDLVEKTLMESGHYEVAKTYIEYRHDHNRRREIRKHLEDVYDQIIYGDAKDSDLRRDNANIDTDAPMGQMLKIGTEAMKHFIDTYVLDPDVRQADKDGYIHVHDKDFSLFTFNCCEIDLLKLFKGGFSTGHGFLREPNSIRSAAALTAIAIQSNQNNMFGGQGVNAFDFAMAPYVDKSFVKAVKHAANEWLKFNGFEEYDMDFSDMKYGMPIGKAREIISNNLNPKYVHQCHELDADRIYSVAMANTEEETKQAMEALIHNLNTLHSRAGSQCPFSSLNFGCDVSPEGHLVIDKLLDAIDNGLGHGETAIFPIAIFQVKSGFNYNPGDPNYDLFEKSCKVSAKRLFPNFVNENVSYNAQYYKPGNYNSLVATMG